LSEPAPAAPAAAGPARWSRPFGWLAAAAIVYMTLVTTLAVVARKLTGWEPPGMQEQMELALGIAIFCALPGVFLRDENVTIDLIDGLKKPRLTLGLRLAALALGFAFMAVTAWRTVPSILDKFDSPETTAVLYIPKFVYALPVMFGVALSVVALPLVFAAALGGRAGAGAMRHLD
jgi:TRAP-type C4-dicarboxylate transport system permease small subunit